MRPPVVLRAVERETLTTFYVVSGCLLLLPLLAANSFFERVFFYLPTMEALPAVTIAALECVGLLDPIKSVLANYLGIAVDMLELVVPLARLRYSPRENEAHHLRGHGFLGGVAFIVGATGLPLARLVGLCSPHRDAPTRYGRRTVAVVLALPLIATSPLWFVWRRGCVGAGVLSFLLSVGDMVVMFGDQPARYTHQVVGTTSLPLANAPLTARPQLLPSMRVRLVFNVREDAGPAGDFGLVDAGDHDTSTQEADGTPIACENEPEARVPELEAPGQ